MNNLAVRTAHIPATTDHVVEKVRFAEEVARGLPQVPILTSHVIHAGTYTRTIRIPKGVFITGALIKRSTILIVSGHCLAYVGKDKPIEYKGYNVLTASAHRKSAYSALTDTYMTMLFATNAKTVAEAEAEFTDELDLLISHDPNNINHTLITGE